MTGFTDLGKNLMTYTSAGIITGSKTLLTTLKTIITTAKKSADTLALTSFKTTGKNAVLGFAAGIALNQYISTAAARTMATSAKTAADNALGVKSPSREFMKTGGFVIAGFAKGILDNIGTSDEAGKNMANSILKATQDELGIHSPSLVFNKEVGRWICKGIAEGIKKDMSAEEAAEKKAQNIKDAFTKAFERIDLDRSIRTENFELWKLGEGKNASPDKFAAESKEYLRSMWVDAQRDQDYYWWQYLNMEDYYKKGEVTKEKYDEAYVEYIKAQNATLEAKSAYDDFEFNKAIEDWDKTIDNRKGAIDTRDKLMTSWYHDEGQFLPYNDMTDKLIASAKADIEDLDAARTAAKNKYDSYMKKRDASTHGSENWKYYDDLAKSAYDEFLDLDNEIDSKTDYIKGLQDGKTTKAIEDIGEEIERQDAATELAIAELGNNADYKDVYRLERANLKDNIEDLKRQVDLEEDVWNNVLAAYKRGEATIDEVNTAEANYIAAKTELANTKNDLSQLDEDHAKKLIDDLEKGYELAGDIADARYQLWEKTEGKKATGAEKDIAKIGMLTDQLASETSLLKLARDEWNDAISQYGRSSNEAQEAYSSYLKKQLDIANIQNEISDINDKAVARQKSAATEYNDYIKKYKKYYEQNGMTEEDLLRDAQLVSGYDANNTIPNMIKQTNKAFENVLESSEYKDLIDNCTGLGSSYVSAVDAGIQEKVEAVLTTTVSMINRCIANMNETRPAWHDTGKYLVMGFVDGIESHMYMAVAAAVQMAQESLSAAKDSIGVASPSKAFAEMGMYAVMGFANGLIENDSLSNNAAVKLGKSAIDNLRKSISIISDEVDSNLDTQPTIRPVLDLSNIEKGTARINTLFSANQAMAVNASFNSSRSGETIQNGDNDSKVGNTYSFTQNNYSPKSLSTVEIYRQTKNQFAAIKGALK